MTSLGKNNLVIDPRNTQTIILCVIPALTNVLGAEDQ